MVEITRLFDVDWIQILAHLSPTETFPVMLLDHVSAHVSKAEKNWKLYHKHILNCKDDIWKCNDYIWATD